MQSDIAHSLWSASIGILIILGGWAFISWVQNAYKSKDTKEEERLTSRMKGSGRRADIALLLMLATSFAMSVWLSMVILSHIEKYQKSILTVPVNFLGRLEGSAGYVFIGSKIDINLGLFTLPFSILAIISFVIYFKYFKGKIVESKWSEYSNKCISCGKICSETVGNTRFCKTCYSSSSRIKYATFTILAVLVAIVIFMMFFFPEKIVRFCDFIDTLARKGRR